MKMNEKEFEKKKITNVKIISNVYYQKSREDERNKVKFLVNMRH